MGRFIGVVAIARNFAIGRDGKLPWYYKADLKFFQRLTSGNAVVMGYKTWLSLKKTLKDRLNIVLSHSNTIEHQPSVLLLRSKEEVLSLAKYLNCDVFIIGGSSVYSLFSNEIEQWYVTEIPLSPEDADTFMPPNFLNDFYLIETIKLEDDLFVKSYIRKNRKN